MSRCYNVIGSGFSGLSAAAFLAKSGKKVNVIEKNQELGGRARQFSSNGFLFDMGPSWYWMPDVFDKFFSNFQKTTSDYYKLKKNRLNKQQLIVNIVNFEIDANNFYEVENRKRLFDNFLELKNNKFFSKFIISN